MTKRKIKTVNGLVNDLRGIRDKMNAELAQMTSKQRTEYFKQLRSKSKSPQQAYE